MNNGIDTFVRNLSFAEKRLVIVTAILNQTKESQNDWARTIESIANQMRVMDEQISRLGRAMGNVFMPILKTILPYLNAFLMVLVEVINWFAILVGYDPKEFDFFGETDKSVNDLADGLANANKQAEKLRSGLRGFDKLNVITSPSDSTSGGGAGTSIDPEILEMFNKTTDEYLNSLINVEMKATRIRDRIMEWLGFTKQINEETGDVSFKFDHITGGTVLGALAIGGTIYSGINGILKILEKVGLIEFSNIKDVFKYFSADGLEIIGKDGTKKVISFSNTIKTLTSNIKKLGSSIVTTLKSPTTWIIGTIALIVYKILDLYKNNEDFKEMVDEIVATMKDNLKPIIEKISKLIGGIINLGTQLYKNVIAPILSIIGKIVEIVLPPLISILGGFINNILLPLIDLIGEILTPIIEIVSDILETIVGWLGDLFDWIKKLFQPFKDLGDILQKNGGIWKNWKDGVKKILDNLGIDLSKLWDSIKSPFNLNKELKQSGGWWYNWSTYMGKMFNDLKKKWQDFIDILKSPFTLHQEFEKSGGWWYNWKAGMKKILSGYFADGGILVNGQWQPVQQYASGGAPGVGQMFIARERGAELVGNIGGHTAVMNNDQIVSSVANGVYQAVKSANIGQQQGTQVYNIYLDEEHLIATYTLDELKEMSKSNGKPITI